MSRELTPEAARAILARDTAEVFLALMKISGEGLETMRVVNNTESITRGGEVFQPWAFDADPPDDSDGPPRTIELTVDNVDREIIRLLREYTGVPQCELVWVMASQPDSAVYGPFQFAILAARDNEMTISLSLGHEEDFLNQAVPAQTYSPPNSPGLFP